MPYFSLANIVTAIYLRKHKAINKMNKVSKVTIEDLKSIPSGTTKLFHLDHPSKLQNARSLAGQVWKNNPELGVRFRCSCDYLRLIISITAESLVEV